MKRIVLGILSLALFAYSPKTEEDYLAINPVSNTSLQEEPHPGKKLMETHCYICHSPSAAEQIGRIAPPMVAIKSRYLKEGYAKEAFIKHIEDFVTNPTDEKVLMFGAVQKFGMMPKQTYPEGAVTKIAEFMFDYQIETPSWFKEHWESHGNGNWVQPGKKVVEIEKPKTLEEIGLEYALSTKKVLGQNLMEAIQKKGTVHALEFCNIEAMPLTDSMATKHNATIKRVSDKNRNPKNKANAEELKYIEHFKKQITTKQEPKPVVLEKGEDVKFYYPITTNTMCLQCHGKTENIQPEVRDKIKKLYPKDLAVDYGENEVRGIWSITFNKK
ncbi:hypothetical protein D3C72_403690 [compost metagenome]